MSQKDYVCIDCSMLLENKIEKCPKCGSNNIRKIDVRIEKVLSIRSGVGINVRKETGRAPVKEYHSRQQLGNNGKEARVIVAIDREKGTYFQHVEQQDDKGNWEQAHHEEESLEEHNRKKKEQKK